LSVYAEDYSSSCVEGAFIPYLSAWLGAIPAVIVALTVSPTTAFLTAVLFLGIQ
jgi:predicted PurR-regulated permease PerM